MVTGRVSGHHIVKNVLIKNNYFENCGGVLIQRDHGFYQITIQNNIFNTGGTADLASVFVDEHVEYKNNMAWAKGVESLWIFNNVFHNNLNYHNIRLNHEDIKDFRFFNNIVYGKADLNWNMAFYIKYHDSLNELSIDNNLYYYPNNNSNLFFIEDTALYYDQTGWQGLGFGANGVFDNPQFIVSDPVDPEDFATQPSSPAIDSGTTVPVYDDYNGNIRPQGSSFDIGAFED